MRQPYIGITGFMTRQEIEHMLAQFPSDSDRRLMVGVLASSKTIRGLPVNWAGRYPDVREINQIFVRSLKALNLIHFHHSNTHGDSLVNELLLLASIAGPNLNGFQLNVRWPDPLVLREVKLVHPDLKFVLQIGGGAMKAVGHDVVKLANQVAEYDGLVDYLLLDPSGGTGTPFNTDLALQYLRVLSLRGFDIGLGVAGGLGPDNLGCLLSIAREFPQVSIDAEGRLRSGEDDHLDLENASTYLVRALRALP